MLAPEFTLRDDFPPVDYDAWRALAAPAGVNPLNATIAPSGISSAASSAVSTGNGLLPAMAPLLSFRVRSDSLFMRGRCQRPARTVR